MTIGKREMMVRFTVFSDKEHAPIAIQCLISDLQATELMAQKVSAVSVAVFDTRGQNIDKTDHMEAV
tara:strand:+ start:1151 stop:1351 length:201 start_codon:yes stop_codon:yes gene_type:complete